MTEKEAIMEAHLRWGHDAYARMVAVPDVMERDNLAVFYEVGRDPSESGPTVTGASCYSFEGAFKDADRDRTGEKP